MSYSDSTDPSPRRASKLFWNSLIMFMQIYCKIHYFSVISWPILILFVLSDRAWWGLRNFHRSFNLHSLLVQIYAFEQGGDVYYASRNLLIHLFFLWLAQKEKIYLGKLNIILVQILKHEWPRNWPSFISDIVGASKTNESLCQNNLAILKLLRYDKKSSIFLIIFFSSI